MTIDNVQHALDWAALPANERYERAAAAAANHDAAALVSLTDAYLTLHGRSGARVSAHTRRVYATSVRLLAADWRGEDLLHPSRDAAASWLRRLEQSGAWRKDGSSGPATSSTVRVRLAGGRALYRALRWAEATTADPFHDVQAAAETTAPWEKRQPYTEQELAALTGAAEGVDRVMILLGAHGGLRASEMCAITWGDVDWMQATVLVRAGKGGKRRQVAASGSLLTALAALPRGSATSQIISVTESGARKRLRGLCRQAGVPYRGLHALRHAAGTRLVREGGSLEDAARHLGHSSLETARIYVKWADEGLRRTVKGW